jgi:hypothetical protein
MSQLLQVHHGRRMPGALLWDRLLKARRQAPLLLLVATNASCQVLSHDSCTQGHATTRQPSLFLQVPSSIVLVDDADQTLQSFTPPLALPKFGSFWGSLVLSTLKKLLATKFAASTPECPSQTMYIMQGG